MLSVRSEGRNTSIGQESHCPQPPFERLREYKQSERIVPAGMTNRYGLHFSAVRFYSCRAQGGLGEPVSKH